MKNRRLYIIALYIGLLSSIRPSLATVNVQVNSAGQKYTAVLLNGSTSGKYNIVFVGDGFTSSASDQDKFNNAVNDAVDAMRHKQPYQSNICAFNIWRVNVISAESGIDHPVSGISKNTELDCTFGDNISQPERVIYSTDESKVYEAANYAPKHDAIYVLVNDAEYGGLSSSVVYTSLNSSMKEVIVHELGHFVGKLADEYTCRFCDGRTEPTYSGPEPWQANVTIETNRNLIKWRSFIDASTPIPTTVDNPVGVVGLWAGGLYSPTVVSRPQLNCLMRILNVELCAVCNDALSKILQPYCTFCERDPLSVLCFITDLRRIVLLYEWPIRFKIPICCFCPLERNVRETEVELSLNQEDYAIEVTDGSKAAVPFDIRPARNGGISVFFKEKADVNYYLAITPRRQLHQSLQVNVSVKRDGRQSVLF